MQLDKRQKLVAIILFVISFLGSAFLSAFALRSEKIEDQIKFLPDTQEVRSFVEIGERYGNFKTVLIGVETEELIATENLKKIKELTEAISKIVGVHWVSSIGNVLEMKMGEDDLQVIAMLNEIPETPEELKELDAKIRANPQVFGQLVGKPLNEAEKLTSAAIIVVLHEQNQTATYEAIQKQALSYEMSDFKLFFYGFPAVGAYAKAGVEGLAIPGVLAAIVFIIFLFLLFGSWRRIVVWGFMVYPAAITGVGLPALLGYPLSDLSAAPFIAALIFCTLIYISYPIGSENENAPLLKNWRKALYIASIAPAFVFTTLSLSNIVPLRGLGLSLSVTVVLGGVMAPYYIKLGHFLFNVREDKKPPLKILGVSVAEMVVCGALILAGFGILAVKGLPSANGTVPEIFGKGAPPSKAIDFFERRFGGSEFLTVVADGNLENPAFLKSIDKLANSLSKLQGVRGVISPADVFKLTNKAMSGRETLPETVGQTQNLWFFLEGQNELSAFMHKREQGLIQLRLSPEAAKESDAILCKARGEINKLPKKQGILDLRGLPLEKQRELREKRGFAESLELSANEERAKVAMILRGLKTFRLTPIAETPEANQFNGEVIEGFFADLEKELADYLLGNGDSPHPFNEAQVKEIEGLLIEGLKDPEKSGELLVAKYLNKQYPEDPYINSRLAQTLVLRAHDIHIKEVSHRLFGGENPKALAFLYEFASPFMVINPEEERELKVQDIAGADFWLTGTSLLASEVERSTYEDIKRWMLFIGVLLVLFAIFGFPGRDIRKRNLYFSVLLVVPTVLASQILWLALFGYSIGFTTFIPLSAGLCGALGYWAVSAGELALYRPVWKAGAMLALPMLVVAFDSDFAPVKNMMGLVAFAIIGAVVSIRASASLFIDVYKSKTNTDTGG